MFSEYFAKIKQNLIGKVLAKCKIMNIPQQLFAKKGENHG
jgi:hypothetical protein